MSKSNKAFDRWIPLEGSTWSHQIFSRYDDQLGKIITAHSNAMKYSYAKLKSQGVTWEDNVKNALGTGDRFLNTFQNLKAWSDTYNDFDNWTNLNSTLTLSGNLETYLAGVVDLAIRSDPGVLFGYSRSIDGSVMLKRTGAKIDVVPYLVACTKGTWSARIASLEKLFGPLPDKITNHIGDLEELREIRNRIGHAFGRDIEEARDHGIRQLRPMEKLSRERAFKFSNVCRSVARALDRHLLNNHIGDFEAVRFFARHHGDKPSSPIGERAVALKKAIGSIGANSRGKIYCRGLISYWDTI